MWKSGFFLTAATLFYSQGGVEKEELFHRLFWRSFDSYLSTEKFSTFHRPCVKNYRQELMLAVMSRMLFCRLVSPFFRASSILRMAYRAVV